MPSAEALRVQRPRNRLIGANPKIGIRPTIDGRLGGVRESLEKQTLTMARSTARFLTQNLRHADGTKVECVIADRCIGGLAEAALAAETFAREGIGVVMDGSNLDDCADYRPGRKAASEAGVRSPLVEARLRKAEIRALSRDMGLPTWDKPAMACLASRFPYGTEISVDKLTMVAAAEEAMKARGFRGFRVRHHEAGGDFVARIELAEEDFTRLLEPAARREIDEVVRSAGYHYVTLDLQVFRSGRLNEALARQDSSTGAT